MLFFVFFQKTQKTENANKTALTNCLNLASHVIAAGYIDIRVCAYVYFTNFLYVVTPRANVPRATRSWGKYVITSVGVGVGVCI